MQRPCHAPSSRSRRTHRGGRAAADRLHESAGFRRRVGARRALRSRQRRAPHGWRSGCARDGFRSSTQTTISAGGIPIRSDRRLWHLHRAWRRVRQDGRDAGAGAGRPLDPKAAPFGDASASGALRAAIGRKAQQESRGDALTSLAFAGPAPMSSPHERVRATAPWRAAQIRPRFVRAEPVVERLQADAEDLGRRFLVPACARAWRGSAGVRPSSIRVADARPGSERPPKSAASRRLGATARPA